VAAITASGVTQSPPRRDFKTKAISPSIRGCMTAPGATNAPLLRTMSEKRAPKSGSSTPNCACTAFEVSPILRPQMRRPRSCQMRVVSLCTR
jgi:hypothetical protein